jgi:hypothetical protein
MSQSFGRVLPIVGSGSVEVVQSFPGSALILTHKSGITSRDERSAQFAAGAPTLFRVDRQLLINKKFRQQARSPATPQLGLYLAMRSLGS